MDIVGTVLQGNIRLTSLLLCRLLASVGWALKNNPPMTC